MFQLPIPGFINFYSSGGWILPSLYFWISRTGTAIRFTLCFILLIPIIGGTSTLCFYSVTVYFSFLDLIVLD